MTKPRCFLFIDRFYLIYAFYKYYSIKKHTTLIQKPTMKTIHDFQTGTTFYVDNDILTNDMAHAKQVIGDSIKYSLLTYMCIGMASSILVSGKALNSLADVVQYLPSLSFAGVCAGMKVGLLGCVAAISFV